MRTTDNLDFTGLIAVSCYDSNNKLKWEILTKNEVTSIGLNHLLESYFSASFTSFNGWALGLIQGPSVILNFLDTHQSHSGWTEFTKYKIDEDTNVRPDFIIGSALANSISNATTIDYSITNAGTIAGIFLAGGTIGSPPGLTDANLKGSTDTAPILWSHSLFLSGEQPILGGDLLKITYNIKASNK